MGANAAAATLGVRVKSGWGAAALLTGPTSSPRVLDCREVLLSDPAFPECRQPFHEGTGVAETNTTALARRVQLVEQYGQASVAELIEAYRQAGHALSRMAIVVSSQIDPDRIRNPHIRAHASEGKLFRTVVEQGARRSGMKATVFLEGELYTKAANVLGRTDTQLKQAVTQLGKGLSRGWRADQKAAAMAAWLLLT